MADVEQTISYPWSGLMLVTYTGIDGDTDAPSADEISALETAMAKYGAPPKRVTFSVKRTGANAFDVDLQGSVRNDSDWKQVHNETTPDTPEGVDLATHAYRYWRFYCTTAGAANTLIIYVLFSWN